MIAQIVLSKSFDKGMQQSQDVLQFNNKMYYLKVNLMGI